MDWLSLSKAVSFIVASALSLALSARDLPGSQTWVWFWSIALIMNALALAILIIEKS